MSNFWEKNKKPILCLAPMHEITDTVYRQVVIHHSKPNVVFSEFVSTEALCNAKSKTKMKKIFLKFNARKEHPIVAQIWGTNPDKFEKSAKYIKSLGFDGIDINMGCPAKNVIKQGGGAKLIENPDLAIKIIEATKRGADGLPVSVKTRIGYNTINTKEWMKKLVSAKPDTIIVHGRTKKEQSKVPAHWKEIGTAAKIIKRAGIVAIGNGDIKSVEEAKIKAKQYGLDGIMVGRGTIGNPWFFDVKINKQKLSPKQKLKALVFHARIYEREFKKIKKFYQFRKIMGAYVNGFNGAKELRQKLMQTNNANEVSKITNDFLKEIR